MNKELNVKLDFYGPDSNMDIIRREAKAEGYVMTAGFKEFVKLRYNARLNINNGIITSITFKDADSKDLKEFKDRREKDLLWESLKE